VPPRLARIGSKSPAFWMCTASAVLGVPAILYSLSVPSHKFTDTIRRTSEAIPDDWQLPLCLSAVVIGAIGLCTSVAESLFEKPTVLVSNWKRASKIVEIVGLVVFSVVFAANIDAVYVKLAKPSYEEYSHFVPRALVVVVIAIQATLTLVYVLHGRNLRRKSRSNDG
jgi:hypothetical protein